MLILLWIVAVLAMALILAYINASGAAFTAAFAVPSGSHGSRTPCPAGRPSC